MNKLLKGNLESLSFAVPVVWHGLRCHHTDCYFCMSFTVGVSNKNRHAIKYSNIPSPLRPVTHNESLPILVAPKTYSLQKEKDLEDFEPSLDHQRPPMTMKGIQLIQLINNLTLLLS